MKKLLRKDTFTFLKMELRKSVVLGSILYDCNSSTNLTRYSEAQQIETAEYVAQVKRKEKGPLCKDVAPLWHRG